MYLFIAHELQLGMRTFVFCSETCQIPKDNEGEMGLEFLFDHYNYAKRFISSNIFNIFDVNFKLQGVSLLIPPSKNRKGMAKVQTKKT